MNETGEEIKGDWSDIKTIQTFDVQEITQESCGHHAQIVSKKQEKWINFEKQGIVYANYGYRFGTIKWSVILQCSAQYNYFNEDFSSVMQVGVINNKQRTNKIIGSVITFTLKSENTVVDVLL